VLDDAGDPQRGVSNVRKELDQDVVALFDNCGSAGTVASLPEVERAGVPNLFVNSVSDKILRPPPPTTYTLNPLYDQQLATLIPHVLQEKGPGTVALVYLDGFSDNIVPSAQWATAQAGGELVATIAVAGDTSNWGPVVIQLRDANPDYVFIAGTTPGSGQLVAAMHEQNYVPPKGVAGAYAMADEIFLQFAGDAAEGVQLVSPIVPASDPKAQACNETLPADQVPGFYTLMGCLSAQALVASLTAAGDDLSSESILKAVKSLDAADIPGLSGLSQSDSPLLTDSLYVWQVQDGKFSLQQPDPIPVPDSAQWMGQ
jgi:branched-chain amino acid transport system substrate-binding protein